MEKKCSHYSTIAGFEPEHDRYKITCQVCGYSFRMTAGAFAEARRAGADLQAMLDKQQALN